jgi:hypothetical protein
MTFNEQFIVPKRYNAWALGLLTLGACALLAGIFLLASSHRHEDVSRFWAVLLQNSAFFVLVVNSSMFFICVTTMAMGGWQIALRRVPEAISALVPVFGGIALFVLLSIVYLEKTGHHLNIYHWATPDAHEDKLLNWKKAFLNPTFFTIHSVLTVLLWSVLGHKIRKISYESDKESALNVEEGGKYIVKNTVWCALFLAVFALTVGSSLPWLWLMSIDAHWYSTMYSWYTFISAFVSGMSLIMLYVVYLKNQGKLNLVTEEHVHDLGKFMFAFSVFWTYLWFSQYMLIWYANIPEETTYFKIRVFGPFRGIFFFNLIVNFLAPLIILMKRGAKRNYTLVTVMAVVIIFGHWVDFFQMVMPGVLKGNAELSWFEFGTLSFFVGLLMLLVGKKLTKASLVPKNHPFLKESIIHHT